MRKHQRERINSHVEYLSTRPILSPVRSELQITLNSTRAVRLRSASVGECSPWSSLSSLEGEAIEYTKPPPGGGSDHATIAGPSGRGSFAQYWKVPIHPLSANFINHRLSVCRKFAHLPVTRNQLARVVISSSSSSSPEKRNKLRLDPRQGCP